MNETAIYMIRIRMVKPPNLVGYKYRKTLKISVFGCSEIYLVVFGFVAMTLKETLIFFDLQIGSSKLFGKLWIWCFLLKEYQIIISQFQPSILELIRCN